MTAAPGLKNISALVGSGWTLLIVAVQILQELFDTTQS